nr:MauE/DoxX family redox-associated membrane protein [Paenibacillus agaridevorans]
MKIFISDLNSYRIVPVKLLRVVAVFLLVSEVLVILSFWSNAPENHEWFSIVILLGFSIAGLYKSIHSKDSHDACSCFGEMTWLNANPFIRNIFLILLALFHLFFGPEARSSEELIYLGLAVFISLTTTIIIQNAKNRKRKKYFLQKAEHLLNHKKTEYILFVIGYKSPYMATIDHYLAITKGFYILFYAPDYVLALKTTKWCNHIVISIGSSNQVNHKHEDAAFVISKHNKKSTRIQDALAHINKF